MRISGRHSNRKLHNWLAYNIGDRFLEKYSIYFKGHLVDLGCGEAFYKDFFLKHAESYTGVDWAKSIHDVKADILSDLNKKIELDDAVADTIVSLSVMEHLYEPQVFLNECYRILKDGGTIIIQVPWQWWIHEAPHDYFRFTPYGLKHILEKAGFKDIFVEATSGFFTTWLLKFNYFSLRFIKGPKAIRHIVKAILAIIWLINQALAPILDKLDKNKLLESAGYMAVAFKK